MAGRPHARPGCAHRCAGCWPGGGGGPPPWPASAGRYGNSRPQITVPARLVYAVAWQESGWQSTIMACDGGIGTMQVMPNTATWMNQRFGTSFDVHALSGNAFLGGQYLAWLVAYF